MTFGVSNEQSLHIVWKVIIGMVRIYSEKEKRNGGSILPEQVSVIFQ